MQVSIFWIICFIIFFGANSASAIEAPKDAPTKYVSDTYIKSLTEGCELPASSKISIISYPDFAQEKNQEGWALVKFKIHQMQPQDIQILDSSPEGIFDDVIKKTIEDGEYVAKSRNTPSCMAILLRFKLKSTKEAFDKLFMEHRTAIIFLNKLNLGFEDFSKRKRVLVNGFKNKCPNISDASLNQMEANIDPMIVLQELSIIAETKLGIEVMRDIMDSEYSSHRKETEEKHKVKLAEFSASIKNYCSDNYPNKTKLAILSEPNAELRSKNIECLTGG